MSNLVNPVKNEAAITYPITASQDLHDFYMIRRAAQPPIARAIANAAPAATLPINAVWSALRTGRVPVKRPFTNPKTNNATSVNATEYKRATELVPAKK